MKLYFLILLNALAQGRIRFEASLRLGNASIFSTNEQGKKKVNLHYAALLEKYVSYLHLSFYAKLQRVFYNKVHLSDKTIWDKISSGNSI